MDNILGQSPERRKKEMNCKDLILMNAEGYQCLEATSAWSSALDHSEGLVIQSIQPDVVAH